MKGCTDKLAEAEHAPDPANGRLQIANRKFRDLDWIVIKALERDRGHRYETTGGPWRKTLNVNMPNTFIVAVKSRRPKKRRGKLWPLSQTVLIRH